MQRLLDGEQPRGRALVQVEQLGVGSLEGAEDDAGNKLGQVEALAALWCVEEDFGKIDILVHSLANGPEVAKPLLETSRKGYLAAISASSYSNVSMIQHFGPLMNKGGAAISLTYLASEKIIPGYGGGMSSAKAALESDTRVLAYEAGRKWGIRVNTISAGPLGSRAAKAIGFIDKMINYSFANAPLNEKPLEAIEIGNTAAFLCSPLASGITGATIAIAHGQSSSTLVKRLTSSFCRSYFFPFPDK